MNGDRRWDMSDDTEKESKRVGLWRALLRSITDRWAPLAEWMEAQWRGMKEGRAFLVTSIVLTTLVIWYLTTEAMEVKVNAERKSRDRAESERDRAESERDHFEQLYKEAENTLAILRQAATDKFGEQISTDDLLKAIRLIPDKVLKQLQEKPVKERLWGSTEAQLQVLTERMEFYAPGSTQ